MQPWIARADEFDRNMTRPSVYGAFDFFKQQTTAPNSILSAEVRDRAFNSMGNTVKIPVIDLDPNVVVANTRSCVIQDNENTSRMFNVTFQTMAIGFTMVPDLFRNNYISYQHDFQRKMEKITRAMANALDKSAIAALEANKSQVYKDKLNYTVQGNELQVPWEGRDQIIGDLNPIMAANDYNRQIHLIGNAGLQSIIGKLAQHGVYNDQNKQLEYMDKVLHWTYNLTNEENFYGSAFAVEDGNVGMLTRVDRAALSGIGTADHEFGIENMPLLNIPVGIHYYRAVGDQSAIAGESSADMNCNVKEYFGFSVDVTFITAYNSDPATIANPISKFTIGSANGNPFMRQIFVANTETNPVPMKTVQ